jgi:hypothetical protein
MAVRLTNLTIHVGWAGHMHYFENSPRIILFRGPKEYILFTSCDDLFSNPTIYSLLYAGRSQEKQSPPVRLFSSSDGPAHQLGWEKKCLRFPWLALHIFGPRHLTVIRSSLLVSFSLSFFYSQIFRCSHVSIPHGAPKESLWHTKISL